MNLIGARITAHPYLHFFTNQLLNYQLSTNAFMYEKTNSVVMLFITIIHSRCKKYNEKQKL